MALMVGSLYDALRSVNVEDDKARRAAEEVADFQKQRSGLSADLTWVKNDFVLLKWMLGLLLASNFAILLRVMSV